METESPLNRVNVPKRNRKYKGRYQMYRKLFYAATGLVFFLGMLLLWVCKGNLALQMVVR